MSVGGATQLRICHMPHSYMRHSSFICVTRLGRLVVWATRRTHTHSFIRVTWLLYTCDMTPSYVWHDSVDMSYKWHDAFTYTDSHARQTAFIIVTWLDTTDSFVTWLHSCVATQPLGDTDSHVRHNTFIFVTWLIHSCVATQSSRYVMTP